MSTLAQRLEYLAGKVDDHELFALDMLEENSFLLLIPSIYLSICLPIYLSTYLYRARALY